MAFHGSFKSTEPKNRFMPKVEATVSSINSSGNKVKVILKLSNASRFFGLGSYTTQIILNSNPGWDEGDEVEISLSKV